ncbi:hypothetical protein HBH95_008320 [Parastagonospora nodorum]|nr:hypothetical protein HBH95_008320 [Parastagonospora nodorum]
MLFLTSCATEKVHICAADGLSSTMTVYNYIKKDKNADLIYDRRLVGKLAIAESVTAKDPNHVDIFGLDFAFSFANILLLIAFIISYCLFADELNIQQSLLDRVTVVLTPSTLLARFIPTTKIRDLFLKKNVAKSRILLAYVDRQIRQCYLTIYAILKHYNFNIYVSLVTDTLHLLLKGLVMHSTSLKRFNNKRAFIELIAVVSLLFILKAPFALHFIYAVCDLNTLAYIQRALERINIFKEEFRHALIYIIQDICIYRALDSICTRANSKAHYITIPYLTKLPLSEVAVNIAISDFTYAAAIYSSIKCWRFSSKRHNDPEYCNEEVVRCLYLILIIINYICYDKDGKHIAYIRAFSENAASKRRTLQAFKFYDLSTIICLVHLVLRDLPNLITYTTMSYYVNNYIN